MKKSEFFFTILRVPVDFAMLIGAALAAYSLRFTELATDYRPIQFELPFAEFIPIVLIISPIWLIIFGLTGLYSLKRDQRVFSELKAITISVSTAMTVSIIALFFTHQLFSSRFIVIAVWFFGILFVAFGRGLVRLVKNWGFKAGYGLYHTVIIGNTSACRNITSYYRSSTRSGHEVLANISKVNGHLLKKIKEIHAQKKLDEIIQCQPDIPRSTLRQLINFAEINKIDFLYTPDLVGTKALNVDVSEVAGTPIVKIKRTPLDGWGQIIKRFIDVAGSLISLIILSPIMAVIALAIKLESPGPVVYRNQRVDEKGRTFDAFKFRYMKTKYCTGERYGGQKALEFEKELIKNRSIRLGPLYKIIDDPRCTRVGRILEKTSLDELPQLFNVFLGQMSLVGPRPHQPREVAKYKKHHFKVFNVKPGMTGLAQISGRSELDFEDEVKLDTYYVENWSLFLDFQILLKTPFAVIWRGRRGLKGVNKPKLPGPKK